MTDTARQQTTDEDFGTTHSQQATEGDILGSIKRRRKEATENLNKTSKYNEEKIHCQDDAFGNYSDSVLIQVSEFDRGRCDPVHACIRTYAR